MTPKPLFFVTSFSPRELWKSFDVREDVCAGVRVNDPWDSLQSNMEGQKCPASVSASLTAVEVVFKESFEQLPVSSFMASFCSQPLAHVIFTLSQRKPRS